MVFLVGCQMEMGTPGQLSNRRSEVRQCQARLFGRRDLVRNLFFFL